MFDAVSNAYGIKVCRKCVSCAYYKANGATYGVCRSGGVAIVNGKKIVKEGICVKGDLRVKGSGAGCGFWEMREQLQHVGEVEGRVHTPEWIEFVKEHAGEFRQGGDAFRRAMIRQYESEHGSRYVDM